GKSVHTPPPLVVYCHLPVVSAAVIATPLGSPASGSVTWATRSATEPPTGNVSFGIGILIGGSIGVKPVLITGASGTEPTWTSNVRTVVAVPSDSVTVMVAIPFPFGTGV